MVFAAERVASLSPMPIYEYVCMSCESHFEELVRNDETPPCPDCGSAKAKRQFSIVRGARPQQAAQLRRPLRRRRWRRLLRWELWLRRPLTA